MIDDFNGRFTRASLNQRLFGAHALVTAPVIWSTAAGTGGPLLWNCSSNKVLAIQRVGFGVFVAATGAVGALGFTGATGQTAAPSTTTAIDSVGNLYFGKNAPGPSAVPYRIGTPTNAGTSFIPFAQITTGALTVSESEMQWIDIDGMITCPPNSWVSVAASATLSTVQICVGLVWEEIDLPV